MYPTSSFPAQDVGTHGEASSCLEAACGWIFRPLPSEVLEEIAHLRRGLCVDEAIRLARQALARKKLLREAGP